MAPEAGSSFIQLSRVRAGLTAPQSTRLQGDGFSVATEAIEVGTSVDMKPGVPVSDHWSCHQVRQRALEDLPRSKQIAVLIPFREQTGRERHRELAGLLDTLLPYAQKVTEDEGASFKFYVIEQSDKGHFNRGALMDVGFQVAQSFYGETPFTVVAQDCDFVPDERLIQWYNRCGDGPLHLASYVYCPGFGGVTIFRNDQYLAMDGYSHSMWGWGGEDDDAMDRWMSNRSRIVIAPNGGRFKDLGKSEDTARDKTHYKKSMAVWQHDNQDQDWIRDGLAGLKYALLSRVPHDSPMVEHIVIELGSDGDQA